MRDFFWFAFAVLLGSALTHHGIDIYQFFLVGINILIKEAQQVEHKASYISGLGLLAVQRLQSTVDSV